MEVGVLGHPETEYWFRIKRGNKKSVKDLESEIYVCVYLSICLISPGRYLLQQHSDMSKQD